MPRTAVKPQATSRSTSKKTSSKNIVELETFIKAYNKQNQAEEELDKAKKVAVAYLQRNINKYDRIKYKNCYLTLCDKKTYIYSSIAEEMKEALSKQKKIEELSGEATLKKCTDYIRLNKAK